MMNKKIVTTISGLIILTFLAGGWFWIIRQNQSVNNSLLKAENIMNLHPDSALAILQNIDQPEQFLEENRALYALLMTQAEYKNIIPVENDSLIKIALDYYSTSKDSIRKAWTYFYMAQVCRDMKDKEQAIIYFQKASMAADSGNYKLSDLIYCHWGKLLQNQKPYEEGLELLQKSERYARLNNDTISLIAVLGEIGWSYVRMKDYKQAQKYFENGIKLAQKLKRSSSLGVLYHNMAISYYVNKQYSNALQSINYSLNYPWEEKYYPEGFSIKGRIFIELQEYDSARYYIEKSKDSTSFYALADYQEEMSLLEEKLGNYPKALSHRKIYANYLDSIMNSKENGAIMELQKKYNYSIIKNENSLLKIEKQYRKIWILIVILLFVGFAFGLYYRYNRIKRKNEQDLHSKEMLLAQSIRQIQQKSSELLYHKQTLQEKENELKQHLIKEKGLIDDIFHKEEELHSYELQQQELKEKIFKMDEVVQKIESLKTLNTNKKITFKATFILSEQECSDLLSSINFCFNNLAQRLQKNYSTLTQEDLYICSLLRMGVSNQNIVILLGTNEEAFKKRKYRIRREKLGIPLEGPSLDDFLLSY